MASLLAVCPEGRVTLQQYYMNFNRTGTALLRLYIGTVKTVPYANLDG